MRIEPQIVAVPKSERVEKERQVSLFNDMPDTNLPPLDTNPPAPVVVATNPPPYVPPVDVPIVPDRLVSGEQRHSQTPRDRDDDAVDPIARHARPM